VERLWAPWRLEFLEAAAGDAPYPCFLCELDDPREDRERLVVHRGTTCVVLLNRYPYANGHLLIAPCRHIASPTALSESERSEIWTLLDQALVALERAFSPHATNVGMNLGRSAGAALEDHLHLHVVPRWHGDVNFMPVLADVRVMPQHLDTTWLALREAWLPSSP